MVWKLATIFIKGKLFTFIFKNYKLILATANTSTEQKSPKSRETEAHHNPGFRRVMMSFCCGKITLLSPPRGSIEIHKKH